MEKRILIIITLLAFGKTAWSEPNERFANELQPGTQFTITKNTTFPQCDQGDILNFDDNGTYCSTWRFIKDAFVNKSSVFIVLNKTKSTTAKSFLIPTGVCTVKRWNGSFPVMIFEKSPDCPIESLHMYEATYFGAGFPIKKFQSFLGWANIVVSRAVFPKNQ